MSRPTREHPRYAHEATVTVTPAGSAGATPGGAAISGRTSNVSRGGMCAEMTEAMTNGAEVEVDITLIFDEETQSEPLRVAGRVVWCTSVGDGYQLGVAFKPLDAEKLAYLTMFLRLLDDGEPAQRTPRESTLDKRFG
ncbi:MAG: PilZ domain-containing protein [Kofleriaceae bacterium]